MALAQERDLLAILVVAQRPALVQAISDRLEIGWFHYSAKQAPVGLPALASVSTPGLRRADAVAASRSRNLASPKAFAGSSDQR